MDFTQGDQRNILYISNLPEWRSVEKYLSLLEKSAMTSLKTSNDIHAIYNAQGAERIIEKLKNIREHMRNQLEDSE